MSVRVTELGGLHVPDLDRIAQGRDAAQCIVRPMDPRRLQSTRQDVGGPVHTVGHPRIRRRSPEKGWNG